MHGPLMDEVGRDSYTGVELQAMCVTPRVAPLITSDIQYYHTNGVQCYPMCFDGVPIEFSEFRVALCWSSVDLR